MSRTRLPVNLQRPSFAILRNSLFVRIFLWFWTAMTLAGIILLALEASRAQELSRRWRGVTADAFATYAVTSAQALEDGNAGKNGHKLKEYLDELENRARIRARLLDEQGRDISTGQAVPLSQPDWMKERMSLLAARARRSGQTEFEPLSGVTLASRLAVSPSGRRYILIGELPAAQYGPWVPEPRLQALRLLAVLLAAGVVCWGLGRYLTAPIVTLRAATQQLAKGNLAARAGADLGERHDELADLARDFDSMAEHIQSLMHEQERLLAEQKQLMSAQRRLLGDVAHELRSPLARVSVALEMARDRSTSAEPGAELVPGRRSTLADAHDRIQQETEHLGVLIDRLLTLARLDSGVQQRDFITVDLAELVRTVATDADFEARPHQRVVSLVNCDDCTTLGSRDLLRSAIENVVRNAVHYTDESTAVEIVLAKEQEEPASAIPMAVITVHDHGPGVPESEQQDIFRPFHRGSQAHGRQSGGGGGGLGLAITARAVELHDGQVRAYNAEDGGLIVEIRLPLTEK